MKAVYRTIAATEDAHAYYSICPYTLFRKAHILFVKKPKKNHPDSPKTFSETDIINMLEFLIANIFVMIGGFWQQTVGIPMGTNCAPFLVDLFLYSYQTDFIKVLVKKKLARSFNFTFRYIDDVLSLSNAKFGVFVDRIYPIELEIGDTTDTAWSASYLDLHLEIDNEVRLRIKLYYKRDDFNFSIEDFPSIYM